MWQKSSSKVNYFFLTNQYIHWSQFVKLCQSADTRSVAPRLNSPPSSGNLSEQLQMGWIPWQSQRFWLLCCDRCNVAMLYRPEYFNLQVELQRATFDITSKPQSKPIGHQRIIQKLGRDVGTHVKLQFHPYRIRF
jgi:hypothetical protein